MFAIVNVFTILFPDSSSPIAITVFWFVFTIICSSPFVSKSFPSVPWHINVLFLVIFAPYVTVTITSSFVQFVLSAVNVI